MGAIQWNYEVKITHSGKQRNVKETIIMANDKVYRWQ